MNDGGSDIRDEDIDTSEIPELSAGFFAGAILTRPGESLIDIEAQVKPSDARFAAAELPNSTTTDECGSA